MGIVHKVRLPRHRKTLPEIGNLDGLPLFEWAKHCPPEHFQTQPLALPVRHISRRYRVAPHLARVIAAEAGFKMMEVNHD